MLFLPKYTASEARKKKNELKVNTCSARPHVAVWVRRLHMCSHTVHTGWRGSCYAFLPGCKAVFMKKKRAVDTQSRVQAVQCCHKHFFASHLPPSGVSVLPFIPCETSPFQFWQHQYSLDMFLQLYFSLMSAICLPDTAVLFYKLCYQSILREGSLFCAPSEVSPFPWGFFSEGLVFP